MASFSIVAEFDRPRSKSKAMFEIIVHPALNRQAKQGCPAKNRLASLAIAAATS
jgi:hypothetical protein